MCPAHFILLLAILPARQALVSTYYLTSFILLLSTPFTPAILLIQLFSHTCSQGWGRLQKPDYDYSAHKIIDYNYDYDYSGDWKGDYDYDYNHPITITITVTCLPWKRF